MKKLFVSAFVVCALLLGAPAFADGGSCVSKVEEALQAAKNHLGNQVALKKDAQRYFSEELFLRPIALDLKRGRASAADRRNQIAYAQGLIASIASKLAKYADVEITWTNSGGTVLGVWTEMAKNKKVIRRVVITVVGGCQVRDVNVGGTKISSTIGDYRKLSKNGSR